MASTLKAMLLKGQEPVYEIYTAAYKRAKHSEPDS